MYIIDRIFFGIKRAKYLYVEMYNEKVRWNQSTFKSSSYWKYVSELLLKFDLLCQWNKGGQNWLKILYHGYCHKWRQALNFWLFILKSWIILMKISTVFSLMHVITPLPSTQFRILIFQCHVQQVFNLLPEI